MLFPLLVFCTKPANNQGEDEHDSQTPSTPATVDEGNYEIKDGDKILVTNEQVEKFLTEVSYPDHDYTQTKILDYPPVAPGKADIPPTFCVRWAPNTSDEAIKVTLSEGDWSREWDLKASADSIEFTNLRPNANYTFEAKTASGNSLKKLSFATEGHVHQVYFMMNVRNARDLGGWKTEDNKTVKYRKIYRGGRFENGTLSRTKGRPEVLAEGIRAQLDLRGHTSSGRQEYLDNNILDNDDPDGKKYPFCAPCIEEGYYQMLTEFKDQTKQCFDFVYQCVKDNNPVYFHCSLGRDRTGTLSMLLLGVLGVREGDISKEYELTQFSPKGWATSEGESQKMTRKVDYRGAANYIWNNFVDAGESFSKGVEDYLISLGVAKADIDDFRSLMLE